jgi:hypothetical protein
VPLTADATRLIETHRRDQAAIRAAFAAEFTIAGRILDADRLDASTPAWLSVAEELVRQSRAQSAERAASYYDAQRRAELGALDALDVAPFTPGLSPDPDGAALRTSLLVTGPVTAKRLIGDGAPPREATRAAVTRAEGAGARHVLGGARDTITGATAADPVAIGWARVTDGHPCWFCAMLASRGPVYKSTASGLFKRGDERTKYHDGCGCEVVPVYSLLDRGPDASAQFRTLWNDVAAGLPAADARLAFRRAIDAGHRARDRRAHAEPPPKLPPRGHDQHQDQAPPATGTTAAADPLHGTDVGALPDDDVYALFGQHSADPDTSDDVLERLVAEMPAATPPIPPRNHSAPARRRQPRRPV